MDTPTKSDFNTLAHALDVIGGRWTLLIILALLEGPHRFTDLMTGLPGISTNLLSQRLKSLEEQGIVRRYTLPRPLSSTVYELTARGLALQRAVYELGVWGSTILPQDRAEL